MAKSRKTKQDNGTTIDAAYQKLRADALLLARGLARSRDRARELIAGGGGLVAGGIARTADQSLGMHWSTQETAARTQRFWCACVAVGV